MTARPPIGQYNVSLLLTGDDIGPDQVRWLLPKVLAPFGFLISIDEIEKLEKPPADGGRVSHRELMQATRVLRRARDLEREAGHPGAAMVINDLTLSLFKAAIDSEFDRLADAAYEQRAAEKGWPS